MAENLYSEIFLVILIVRQDFVGQWGYGEFFWVKGLFDENFMREKIVL